MTLSPKLNNEALATFAAPLVLQLGHGEVSARRLALLAAVAESGSISQAAKRVGMTYKAAWDAVETMNNLAGQALVLSQRGGAGGGGAQLTTLGSQVVATHKRLHSVLASVLEQFATQGSEFESFSLLRSLFMKTSARNALRGTVEAVHHGAVNSEVVLRLQGDDRLHVIITKASAESLNLAQGSEAVALIKASWVLLAAEGECEKVSARNRLCGVITHVTEGAVNAEVVLELPGGNTIAAIITEGSLDTLGFKVGEKACALIKASSIILAVD